MGPCPRAFQFTKYASSGFSRVAHSKTTKGREKWKINKKKKEKGGKQEAKKKKKIDRKGKWVQEVYLALWNRTSMG